MPYKNKELGRILKREYYRLRKERHIAKQKEYAALPEVRERIRQYNKIRNQRPERRLQKRQSNKRRRMQPEVREKTNEAERRRYAERKARTGVGYGNPEKKRAAKKLYSKRPEVRKRKNELARKYYREQKERVKAALGGYNMPSATQIDKERFWISRASKILIAGHSETESKTLKEIERKRKERVNARARAYRARPEVRERLRRYGSIRSRTPEFRLQRRTAYARRKHLKVKEQ